jgi:RNA-directed DNA polymerase
VRQEPRQEENPLGPEAEQLLEAVVERENMWRALKQVEGNRGAAGVDNMTVEQLRGYLREHWLRIKEELLAGDYQPAPVRQVEIPKPGGRGMRMLGIPTVLDRLIRQALQQVLSPLFEGSFSESSYGFRPQRSATTGGAESPRVRASGAALGGGHRLGEVLRPG